MPFVEELGGGARYVQREVGGHPNSQTEIQPRAVLLPSAGSSRVHAHDDVRLASFDALDTLHQSHSRSCPSVVHGDGVDVWLLRVVSRRDGADHREEERTPSEDVDGRVNDGVEDGEEDVQAVVEDLEQLVDVFEVDEAHREELWWVAFVQETTESEILRGSCIMSLLAKASTDVQPLRHTGSPIILIRRSQCLIFQWVLQRIRRIFTTASPAALVLMIRRAQAGAGHRLQALPLPLSFSLALLSGL